MPKNTDLLGLYIYYMGHIYYMYIYLYMLYGPYILYGRLDQQLEGPIFKSHAHNHQQELPDASS